MTTQEEESLEEASTAELVHEAIAEARELARLEIELAKAEVVEDIARAKRAALGLAAASAAAMLVVCLLAVALVLALGGTATVALALAGAVFVAGLATTAVGVSSLPTRPLERTRARLSRDARQLQGPRAFAGKEEERAA